MVKFSKLEKLVPLKWRKSTPVVHVVRLQGAIGIGSTLRPGLSLESLEPVLEKAFSRKGLAAVALVINSPGGSPVQSALIHDRIRQLARENEVEVLSFCEDVAASGGYWLAVAGDEIYADASSIIGSIGVIAAGFGFTKAIDKLGIERRVYTAGENKLILDPFQPQKASDVERLEKLQLSIHDKFKSHIRARRAGKLDPQAEAGELFSGAFWTGEQAHELGLLDGLGHLHQVLKSKFGDKVVIKPISRQQGFLKRFGLPVESAIGSLGGSLGANLTEDVLTTVETRALWQRYGL